jgi:amino acid permease
VGLCNGLEVSSPPPSPLPPGLANFLSYALQWLVVLPLEIVAATFTIEYWNGGNAINNNAYVAIFLVLIVAINLFGYVKHASCPHMY